VIVATYRRVVTPAVGFRSKMATGDGSIAAGTARVLFVLK